MLPPEVWIQVDGGVEADNAAGLVAAGADELVVGRALAGAADARALLAHRQSI